MKNIVFVTLVFIGLMACKHEQKPTVYSWFTPNQKCWVNFNFSNLEQAKEYDFYYNQHLPWHQVVKRFVVEGDSSVQFALSLNHPSNLYFWQDKEGIRLFIRPNDTIEVNIDNGVTESLNASITFGGNTANIATYLKQLRKFYYGSPYKGQGAESYNHMLDSFYRVELHKLDSVHEHKIIHEWFYPIERTNILCEREDLKFMQFGQHVWFHDTFIERDKSLEKETSLPNIQYQYLDNYQSLLFSFRPHKYDSLLQFKYSNDNILFQCISDNMEELVQKDSEVDWSFFIASRLSDLYNEKSLLRLSPTEFKDKAYRIDSFIQSKQHLIKDTLLLNYMLQCKAESYEAYHNQNHLNAGIKAPNFYLKNNKGESHDLSDYKGKMVLLNVWGTFCAPCIWSIPAKNALLKEMSDKDFVLLNVCIDYNPDQWEHLIAEHDFGGEHLICKGNWADNIKTKYNTKGVPHYCLIDKEGLVLQNGIHPDSLHVLLEKTLNSQN